MKHASRGVVVCLTLLMSFGTQAQAALEGVSVPDTQLVNGTTVKLNGVGLRTATFLKVKVYVMALYLETPSGSATAIIDSTDAARIELHMLRAGSLMLAIGRLPRARRGRGV